MVDFTVIKQTETCVQRASVMCRHSIGCRIGSTLMSQRHAAEVERADG